MKITIYELLGMIKDNKAPKKIKIDDDILTLSKTSIIQYNFSNLGFGQLNWDYYIENYRLDEKLVEILDKDFKLEEEKKIPEKLEFGRSIENGEEILTVPSDKMIIIKINEIIDYLKSKGE